MTSRILCMLLCATAIAFGGEVAPAPAWNGRWLADPTDAGALPVGVDGVHLCDGRAGIEQRGSADIRRIDDATLLVDWMDKQEWENLVIRRRDGMLYVSWWHIEIPYVRPGAQPVVRPDGSEDGYDEIRREDILGLWRPALRLEPFERMARRLPRHITQHSARQFHEQRQLKRWPGGIDLEFSADGSVNEVRWTSPVWHAQPDDRWRMSGVYEFAGGADPLVFQDASDLRLEIAGADILLRRRPEQPARPSPEARIEYAMRTMGVPGCIIAVIDHPQAGRRCLGVADVARPRPPLEADHWWLASLGKLVVGRVVLELVAEGRLRLDDTVSRHWPAWPGPAGATIDHLLRHRSGLANPIAFAAFKARIVADPTRWWQASEPLDFACSQEPRSAPGAAFSYTNAGSEALARLCELATESVFTDLARARVLVPAGCSATGFGPRPQPHPAGYRHTTPRFPILYGASFLDVSAFSPSWAGLPATMWSTVGDLERLLPVLCDGAGLPDDLIRRQRDWMDTGQAGFGYGLHLARIGTLVGHAGDVPGGSALIARDQRSAAGIIVLCNQSNAPDGRNPAVEIARIVADELAVAP